MGVLLELVEQDALQEQHPPLDKIHVIEPYITACHYVTNNQEENDSKVYNFTMSEYFEHKQALQAGVGIGDCAR